jgi:hypothetical protein
VCVLNPSSNTMETTVALTDAMMRFMSLP